MKKYKKSKFKNINNQNSKNRIYINFRMEGLEKNTRGIDEFISKFENTFKNFKFKINFFNKINQENNEKFERLQYEFNNLENKYTVIKSEIDLIKSILHKEFEEINKNINENKVNIEEVERRNSIEIIDINEKLDNISKSIIVIE